MLVDLKIKYKSKLTKFDFEPKLSNLVYSGLSITRILTGNHRNSSSYVAI